jgi:formamidopyrimidine-DNA glycosylase
MPELPEVETVRRTLESLIKGKKITQVVISYPKIIHMDQALFQKKIVGQTIQDLDRMGKYLIWKLDHDVLIIHLRMEGRFYIKKEDEPLSKHEHVGFHLSSKEVLTYHDVRKFGTMDLLPMDSYLQLDPLNRLGKEPKDLTYEAFFEKINKRHTEIKAIMLDQSVIAGLGNIYVDETLFQAKVHPERKGITITKSEAIKLLDAARWVLNEAIKQGGTTIRTFQAMDGVHGRFQNELAVHTKVSKPCPICQTPIIKIKVKGRGTYVCPNCQT